jgi:uncharacterized membrane protein
VSESSLVRRPLEIVFSIAIAFIVLGLAVAVVRWALGGSWEPFDGTFLNAGLQILGIFLLVVFGLAVAGIVIFAIFAFGPWGRHAPWGGPRDWSSFEAVANLKKRYANGLVSREDYLRLLGDLESHPAAPAEPAAPPPAPVQK